MMDREEIVRRRRRLLCLGAGGLLVGMLYCILAFRGIGIPCLFYRVTGWQCPGCGNSRAALALLQLDPVAALGYNPLFPLEFFYLGWVLLHCCVRYLRGGTFGYKSRWIWLDWIILGLVLLWGPVRNLI